MIDLRFDGAWGLDTLMLQRGGQFFDPQGNVAFATEDTAELIRWYILQTRGPEEDRVRLRLGAAGRQGDDRRAGAVPVDARLAQLGVPGRGAVAEGQDGADAAARLEAGRAADVGVGRHRPHHHEGGRSTRSWPGSWRSSSTSTRRSWAKRFQETNILPVLKDAWNLPEFDRPNPYWSNLPIGRMYAALAPETPPVYSSPVDAQARIKLDRGVHAVGRPLPDARRGGADGGDPREPGRGRGRRARAARTASSKLRDGAAMTRVRCARRLALTPALSRKRERRKILTRGRRRTCSCRRT